MIKPKFGGTLEQVQLSLANRDIQLIVETIGSENAPLWLLLPALSTVSSRSEWKDFIDVAKDVRRIVSFDWPGFGDSDRPPITYDADVLCQALVAILQYIAIKNNQSITIIAAGHSASIALGMAAKYSNQWEKLVLVAPTWRGPFPTMTGLNPQKLSWIRKLISLPLIGPVLYRLNTSKTILKLMLRRHVWVDSSLLSPEKVLDQQRLSRRTGARFASAAFVSGGLDPAADRSWWLQQAEKLSCPMEIVLADEAPPRSRKEMELLADHANHKINIKGRLGLHQEFGSTLARRLLSF